MFWRSTWRKKPKGTASIDWRTLSSACAGIGAEDLLQQRFGRFQTAAAATGGWVGLRELVDDLFLLLAGDRPHAGDFDRDLLDLLGLELARGSC